ncbi:hypothetical protein [Streptomyces sp. NPDC001970]
MHVIVDVDDVGVWPGDREVVPHLVVASAEADRASAPVPVSFDKLVEDKDMALLFGSIHAPVGAVVAPGDEHAADDRDEDRSEIPAQSRAGRHRRHSLMLTA